MFLVSRCKVELTSAREAATRDDTVLELRRLVVEHVDASGDSSAAAAMRSTSSAAGVAGSTVRVSSSALMKRSSTASAAGSAR